MKYVFVASLVWVALGCIPTVSGQVFTETTFGDGGLSYAAAWGDYDADGLLDLHVVNGLGQVDFLYRNTGDGLFERVISGAVVSDPGNASFSSWLDLDGDGDLDLVVIRLGDVVAYYRYHGDSFSSLPGSLTGLGRVDARRLAAADFDRDGDLDLYVTQRAGQDNVLFVNRGDGTFLRDDLAIPANDGGDSTCAEWTDVDDDGILDLYVCNTSYQPNVLYRGLQNGLFERVESILPTTDPGRSTSASWADFDGDGDLDLFVTNIGGLDNVRYRNDGGFRFVQIEGTVETSDGGDSNASNAVDVDNDGDIDLFVSNRGGRNFLYLNDGTGSFSKVEEGPIVESPHLSSHAAWADYDRDGDLDVFVSNMPGAGDNGDDRLYRNEITGAHWLHLRLRGRTANTYAIGARVDAFARIGGRRVQLVRELSSGVGTMSGGLELAFGLGDAQVVDRLVIRWPTGTRQVLFDVSVDRLMDVHEPAAALPPTGSGSALLLGLNYPNPFETVTSVPFEVDGPTEVALEVVDLAGRRVWARTVSGLSAGRYHAVVDGQRWAPGIYRVRASSGAESASVAIVKVR